MPLSEFFISWTNSTKSASSVERLVFTSSMLLEFFSFGVVVLECLRMPLRKPCMSITAFMLAPSVISISRFPILS